MTERAPDTRPSVSRLSPKDAEEEAARVLIEELAPRIDAFNEAVDHPAAATVRADSPLGGDDKAADPFQVSHTAWHSLVHAADNLRALRLLTVSEANEDRHVQVRTHPFAAYPLLRAALENASIALWLLAPDRRDTRLTRRFRLAIQDAGNGDKVVSLMGRTPTNEDKHRARVADLIANRPAITPAACNKPAGFGVVVSEAAEGSGIDPSAALAAWRLLSAFTHGDQWASLAFADREEVGLSVDGKVVTVRMTASLANISNMARVVIVTAETALRAYNLRRTPTFP
jgi:hypothetical protein